MEEPDAVATSSIIVAERINKVVLKLCQVLVKIEISLFVFSPQMITLGTLICKYAVRGVHKYMIKILIQKIGTLQRSFPEESSCYQDIRGMIEN